MIKFFSILFLSCLFLACSKNNSVDDKILPVIAINSPSNGQTFAGGTTVNITADITDNDKLVEIHVHIYNQATGQLLIDIHRYPNAASYSLNESFLTQNNINYTIRIIAIDKSANQQMQTISVSTN